MQIAGTRTLLALAVMAACRVAAQPAGAEDYPYPGVFMNFERKTYNEFSPTLKEAACYERLFVQDEKGDFTTYALDGLQWLRDRKIVYLVVSSGHCDFFAHAGIEQCSIEDASDGTKREAFSRLLGLGALGIEERIYDSEKDLLTDRGVDAIRIKCGSVDAIKPFLTTEKLQKGSCHEAGKEGEECYYEPSAAASYNDMVGSELRKIRDVIQKK
jgi:hypothetical protein